LKVRRLLFYVVVVALLVALALVLRQRVHFQWSVFAEQMRSVSWQHLLIGLVAIYINFLIRGLRWEIFLRPTKKVPVFSLIGSQVIGFTAVAIFGRLADLVRPYLVAKRTQLAVSTQIAIYTVERMFDLGSFALIASLILLFTPDRASLPHHQAVERSAMVGLAITAFLAVFAFSVRMSGLVVANLAEKSLGVLSPKVGLGVATKIREFREGLNTLTGFGNFLFISALSFLMWVLITLSYIEVCHSFVASPELSHMDAARVIILQTSSLAGSIVQLPVIGWFTTIAFVAAAMQNLFGVKPEPALGCSALILLITSMGIIPAGLIWSRFEHVSLKKVAQASEQLEDEELVAGTEA
jgi:hypothetical protein